MATESAVPKVKGVYKVGKPYVINGVTYTPTEDPSYDRIGVASWYGTEFHGKQTANGERFDMNAITAAHPTLPMPSYLYVTNIRNGRTLLVRLNDRGPYKRGRIIDLSRRTAQLLGFDAQGTTEIRVRYAGPAPLDPTDTSRERQYLASQHWSRAVRTASGAMPPYGLGMARPATP
jgi:rare lipoprotein A